MDKLKLIVENKERHKDPTWQNLYNSDIRNLFPKYQLSKIQKAKVKYDKFRLMMDNLEDFLYLEAHRREKKMLNQQIDNIKADLQQICVNDDQYHYKIGIIEQRDNLDQICKELNVYGNQYNSITDQNTHKNKQLHSVIKNNQKWNNYVETNCKKLQKVPKQHNFVERAQLAETVQIPNTYQSLNQSTASQIMFNRVKREQIKRKILEKWMGNHQNQQENSTTNIEKSFIQDWKSQIKDVDFKQYV